MAQTVLACPSRTRPRVVFSSQIIGYSLFRTPQLFALSTSRCSITEISKLLHLDVSLTLVMCCPGGAVPTFMLRKHGPPKSSSSPMLPSSQSFRSHRNHSIVLHLSSQFEISEQCWNLWSIFQAFRMLRGSASRPAHGHPRSCPPGSESAHQASNAPKPRPSHCAAVLPGGRIRRNGGPALVAHGTAASWLL